jgi:bla regulator protein BlaR1
MHLATNEWAWLAWTELWQVTLLATAVLVVARLFGRRRPHMAYLLWMLVIAKCLTPPIWASPLGLFSRIQTPIAGNSAATVNTAPSEALKLPRAEVALPSPVVEESTRPTTVGAPEAATFDPAPLALDWTRLRCAPRPPFGSPALCELPA